MKITCWCRNPLLRQCTSNSAHVGRLPHGAQSFELAILRSHPKIYLSLTSSIVLRDQYFHFFSWLLAGNSYMVTSWWCLTYTLITYWWHVHHLLYWRGHWSHDDSLLICVLVDSCAAHCCDSELRLTIHYWSAYCFRWLRTAHYCTLLRTVTPIVRVTLLFSYSI